MDPRRPNSASWLAAHPVLRLVLYYLVLAVALAALYRIQPDLPGVFSTEQFEQSVGALKGGGPLPGGTGIPFNLSPVDVAFQTVIAMLGGVLLMLPVAWVHILTRSRKGFSQSTVQTLIFLPLVVAGVLILVQHSVALAFGLGGVVGAVSFRNRLEDPKDAIYIFVAIAVGLACGVQVLSVAAVISIFFNLIVLAAWRFDFGRMPAQLEAGIATRRLERAKAEAQAPQDFLKLVDNQLLKSMTPDQLQALAARAKERSRKVAANFGVPGAPGGAEAGAEEEPKARFDSMLRITMQPDDAAAIRATIEQVLNGQTKRWEFEKAGATEGGRATAQYKVKFKKSIPSTLVIEAMRRGVLPKVVTIDVRDA